MLFRLIFILIALGLPSLYLNKGGVAVFVGLALIISLIPLFKNRGDVFSFNMLKGAIKNWPLRILLLFILSSGVSSYLGIYPDYNMSQWGKIVAVLLGGIIMFTGIRYARPSDFEHFLKYTYYTLGFFSVWALIDHTNLIPAFTEFVHGENPKLTKFSSVIAIVLPFALGYTLNQRDFRYWVVPALAITASVACGGRSGWLALVASTSVVYFSYPWETVYRKRRNRLIFKVIAVVGVIIGLIIHKMHVSADAFASRLTLSSPNGMGSGRLNIWDFALEKYMDHPWLGIGVKGFRKLDFSEVTLTSTMHPHNALIEILLETGAVGLFFALSFVLVVMYRLIKTLYKNVSYTNPVFHITALCSLSGLVAFTTASMTLTSIFHSYWLSYLVVLIVLMEVTRMNIIQHKKNDYSNADKNKKTTESYGVAVSVIMPCYNAEKFIKSAIESVQAQTFENWELIIFNDGSKDSCKNIIEMFAKDDKRIKILNGNVSIGSGLARKEAIKIAKGRYVAFLDSDDKWRADKLEKQVLFMESTEAPLSGTHYYVINEHDEVTGIITPSKDHVTYFSMLKANDIGCLTAMYDVHQLGKMYMGSKPVAQDLQLWLDILKEKPFGAIIHEPLAYYRVHTDSKTYRKGRSIKMRWQMIKDEKEVSHLRSVYYFVWYALNGVCKSIKGRIGCASRGNKK